MSSKESAAFGFPRSLRLIKTSDYGVLVHVRRRETYRVSSRFFSATVLPFPEYSGRVRFGITVGKRNSRRSVDRALIKRILREAARKQAPLLVAYTREQGLGLDVSLRLKSPLESVPGQRRGVTALKKALNEDVACLMERLLRRVKHIPKAGSDS